ncbi:CDP-glucose 4,6-dehydratase [Clostridium bowmanii]|uniref:CDP-glucose 4,6-dehydratase n=1 Tax=Clostridium bowmanii TaxID=132925 RepID=UPI001C0C467D|nr:CDP-glucose 4,6-dehydratase [Clostridium bowmanii]MBU3191624.1 CDP-glucose 4,6-dehydratase [Clostridium bowmanii]MCA1075900.1 CDP-glucose 4,6-dehydratase [Clostridium bowmanii]
MEKRGVDLFNGFYKNKRVLITGHTGFKGSWLSIWLHKLGAIVIGYGLDPYTGDDNFVVSGLKNKIIDIRGDIRDYKKLLEVFNIYKPDIVFHLAAQALVKRSYENPIETYEINVMGTLNVLECIKNSAIVSTAIMVTTDKCYKNIEQIWGYREDDPMGGYDPYSSSKGCAEILIDSYRNSFINPKDYNHHGKAIATVRAGNVIGGGDWSVDRIIPDCIRAINKNKDIKIRNQGAVRPWQHVIEPLGGYLLLASKMFEDGVSYCSGWNFGPSSESIVTVSSVVDRIIAEWGYGKCIDNSVENAPHEANLLILDCTKAKTYLNWSPKFNIEQALKLTVDWYKNFKNKDTYDLCISQIESYCKIEI